MFKRLIATSRAPQIMVLSMLRSFGKIGPQIDQIWAWLSRGHRWSPGVRNPLKSLVTGPSLLVNCYLEIRVNPPPPPPPPLKPSKYYLEKHVLIPLRKSILMIMTEGGGGHLRPFNLIIQNPFLIFFKYKKILKLSLLKCIILVLAALIIQLIVGL